MARNAPALPTLNLAPLVKGGGKTRGKSFGQFLDESFGGNINRPGSSQYQAPKPQPKSNRPSGRPVQATPKSNGKPYEGVSFGGFSPVALGPLGGEGGRSRLPVPSSDIYDAGFDPHTMAGIDPATGNVLAFQDEYGFYTPASFAVVKAYEAQQGGVNTNPSEIMNYTDWYNAVYTPMRATYPVSAIPQFGDPLANAIIANGGYDAVRDQGIPLDQLMTMGEQPGTEAEDIFQSAEWGAFLDAIKGITQAPVTEAPQAEQSGGFALSPAYVNPYGFEYWQ